jgi:DNA modification methylase
MELYHGDCRDIIKEIDSATVDLVLTDPPYPNNAGHFIEGIEAAIEFMQTFKCDNWLVFWDELERPPVPLPLVAVHIWHRSNTNRPDNYESIYHFCADGKKRASRVFSYPVIYPGLTGCTEATGHPTQKNTKLIKKLLQMMKPYRVIDPFMGSGTTAEACHDMKIECIGIEKDRRHYDDACKRIQVAESQPCLL